MKTTPTSLTETGQQIGLLLMTAAATLGLFEVPELHNKVVVPNQPAFAHATDSMEGNNPMRREKEESGVHYVSYSAVQRTPGRTGRF